MLSILEILKAGLIAAKHMYTPGSGIHTCCQSALSAFHVCPTAHRPTDMPVILAASPKACVVTGAPLLYFYDRDYWSTARASLALANISDARESELLSRNTELIANCDNLSTENAQLKAKNAATQLQLQKLMTLHLKVAKDLVEPSRFWELPAHEQVLTDTHAVRVTWTVDA